MRGVALCQRLGLELLELLAHRPEEGATGIDQKGINPLAYD